METAHGRSGLGALMGSKRLKAVVVSRRSTATCCWPHSVATKRCGSWGCWIGCGDKLAQTGVRFPLELNGGIGHKLKYDALCMVGTNLLNDDLASIVKVNELCNNLGIDSVPVDSTIGYAIECYENGLLTKK
jgi:aldehyde:ferredoxin oxidoreductase